MSDPSGASRQSSRSPLGSSIGSPDGHALVRDDERVVVGYGMPYGPDTVMMPASSGALRSGRAAQSGSPSVRGLPDAVWPDSMWDEPPRRPSTSPAEEPIIDFAQLRELLAFPWRAVRRRRSLAGGVFAAVLGAAALVLLIAPRQYDVETDILAQRNFVMPALGNPHRAVPAESDAPTHMAAEVVLNRENLLSILQEVGLERAWPRLRTPLGRAQDGMHDLMKRPTPMATRREMLVNYLRTQLWVQADEGTVRIVVHFPDPQLALQIVQGAQRNFLEQRHAS